MTETYERGRTPLPMWTTHVARQTAYHGEFPHSWHLSVTVWDCGDTE